MSIKRKTSKTLIPSSARAFVTGMGSVFNIAGNYYNDNCYLGGLESDANAISSDWAIIGQDLDYSVSCAVQELKTLKDKQLSLNFNG